MLWGRWHRRQPRSWLTSSLIVIPSVRCEAVESGQGDLEVDVAGGAVDPDDALREPDLVAVDDDEVGLLGLVVDPGADHVVAATDQLDVLLVAIVLVVGIVALFATLATFLRSLSKRSRGG